MRRFRALFIALCAAIVLLPTIACAAGEGILTIYTGTLNNGSTEFFVQRNDTNEAIGNLYPPTSGRLGNMYVTCSSNTTKTFTARLSGSDQSLVTALSFANANHDTTSGHFFDYTGNSDTISVKSTGTGVPTCIITMLVAPHGSNSGSHNSVLVWRGSFANPGNNDFGAPANDWLATTLADRFAATSDVPAAGGWIAPGAGNFAAIGAIINSARSAGTETLSLFDVTDGTVSDAAATIALSGTNGAGTSCSSHCAVAGGDTVTVQYTESQSIGDNKYRGAWVEGTFNQVDTSEIEGWTGNGTIYGSLGQGIGWNSAQAIAVPVPKDVVLQNLHCYSQTAPSAGTITCTVLSGTDSLCNNDTTTGITCNFTSPATSCPDTSDTSPLSQGGTYCIKINSSASMTGVNVGYSFELADGATPTPTNTPNDTATSTPTVTSTPTSTPTVTDTPTSTPTVTSTPTSTPTSTNTATSTVTNTPTATPADTSTATPTSTNTATPTSTPTNTRTSTPTVTNTPTRTPTNTPTSSPTDTPSPTPTGSNTPSSCVAVVQATAPVFFYRLDENFFTAFDLSGNGFDATYAPNPPFFPNLQQTGATSDGDESAAFGVTDNATLADATALALNTPSFSMTAYVLTTALSATEIVHQQSADGRIRRGMRLDSNGDLVCLVGVGLSCAQETLTIPGVPLNDGAAFHWVACTFDASTGVMTAIADDVIATRTIAYHAPCTLDTSSLIIANADPALVESATLDEVTGYGSALPPDQLTFLRSFCTGEPTPTPPPSNTPTKTATAPSPTPTSTPTVQRHC